MKLLVLDFDGVIADSAREAFEVARRDLAARCGRSRRCATATRRRCIAAFVALMPLGNRAEDFGGRARGDRGGRRAARIRRRTTRSTPRRIAAWLRAFHERFYVVRAEFSSEDPRGWSR